MMITDPTSLNMKNVTPHCSQIQDVLDFFKRAHLSLESLESTLMESLEEQGIREDYQDLDLVIEEKLLKMLGGVESNLLGQVLRVPPCSECFREVQDN